MSRIAVFLEELSAMLETIMRQMGIDDPNEAVRRINFGEWVVYKRSWTERDGMIDLGTFISDGTTGPGWIKRLKKKGRRVSEFDKGVFNSKDFNPTSGVSYHVVVLRGILWNDSDRITNNIRAEAERRNFQKHGPEVACLVREKFTDEEIKEMGLVWIVDMHEPILDYEGYPMLLYSYRGKGGRWLHVACDGPDRKWDADCGFSFVVPQANAQNLEPRD